MRKVGLLVYEELRIIISTSTIGYRRNQYDSLVRIHTEVRTAWYPVLVSVFPRREAAVIEEVSRQASSSPWSQRLRVWGVAAERLVFSLDERHWTNSLALWVSLNALDSALTWQTVSLGGYEANPFLKLATQSYGDAFMLVMKMALALLFGVLVWRIGSRRFRSVLNLGMSLVVITNCIFLCRPMWLLHLAGQ